MRIKHEKINLRLEVNIVHISNNYMCSCWTNRRWYVLSFQKPCSRYDLQVLI
nr:MAG TPA_asm: hypothetical protein [Caudoviricetes sp.]